MNEKWEQVLSSAKEAVKLTLENGFDVFKTAKELNDSYEKSDSKNK
ncbi:MULTISPECIES: hypothetical protein [Paenibacillus]|nr:hypothetical protein [Paenibacillus macerans]MCY7559765.1 hypothetical protein [Paenibacillus macerans]MEC0151174.1 hypothetical protein [Paenibacillus macerans]SUA82317.1 Uncharacterised protein [Paenibacillus macerans]